MTQLAVCIETTAWANESWQTFTKPLVDRGVLGRAGRRVSRSGPGRGSAATRLPSWMGRNRKFQHLSDRMYGTGCGAAGGLE